MFPLDDFLKDHEICINFDTEMYAGAIIPPTYANTLFVFPSYEEYVEAETNQDKHYVYWRGTNPTVKIVENKLAALERGECCKCFASGMAAITAAIFNSIRSKEHILCISNIYKSSLDLISYLKKFDIEHSVIYSTKIEDISNEIKTNTKVIFIENPTDLKFQLINLQEIANIAKLRGIRTIVDNTWATPLFQKPLRYGIDIVVHSASKYLGGHSNLMGGAIITSKQIMNEIFKKEYLLFGGVMSPREASLLLNGLRSLPLRMKAHQEHAKKIADFLSTHPAVAKVNHPGLFPYGKCNSTFTPLFGYSGLLSFELKDACYESVKNVINKVRVFKIGVSWGSFESLIISPNLGTNESKLINEHISPGLIRLSIGLEEPSILIADLNQALS
jgi:cystathionine beta-lyase/cystathionine gamma-synthase